MGFLSRIFGSRHQDNKTSNYPDEYRQILAFHQKLDCLLKDERFIARSDYKKIVKEFASLPPFLEALERSQMLENYISVNGLDKTIVYGFIKTYRQLKDFTSNPDLIKRHNQEFIKGQLIKEKAYLDNILKECDPNIMLDDEQREVVLSDEDYTLVIAGAGAGKTTTVAAKVRYLVEKKGINPEHILVHCCPEKFLP